jgi:integrase
MASVFERGEKWYVRYKDGRGRWRSVASTARTKTEAKRLAAELEQKSERQRLGLEELPPEDGGGTLGELLTWWLETYLRPTPAYRRMSGVVRKHFENSDLAGLRLTEVTPAKIEVFLQQRSLVVGANTVNHLRSDLLTAFNQARRAGRWTGQNPVLDVRRRKVPKRLPNFLRVEEVPRVLAVLSEQHRPLFATAIYTGMRKGELAGLRKSDVDFSCNLIMVQRSYDRDTTKGGKAAAIPIAQELRPYLETAMASSRSELVFTGIDGEMLSPNLPLEEILRRALGRAGIVTGYVHVCRKKDCGYSENASDNELRRCPKHGHKLWPKAQVRPIRFHDLRHTTGSLLLMAGANPAAVQRILRHSDPRVTMDYYGHLLPNYLRDEIDRLRFNDSPEMSQAEATASSPLVTSLSQMPADNDFAVFELPPDPANSQWISVARPAGLEPATSGLEMLTRFAMNRHYLCRFVSSLVSMGTGQEGTGVDTSGQIGSSWVRFGSSASKSIVGAPGEPRVTDGPSWPLVSRNLSVGRPARTSN